MSGQGQLTVHPGVDNPYRPRLSFYHQTGETLGLDDSFTRLSSFVPFGNHDSPWVTFADIQASFLEDGVLGGSFGLGRRYRDQSSDLVYGLSLYYDYRDGQGNGFQQVSPGAELLGRDWEARANVYLPRLFSDRQALPNQFRDTFLFTDRFQTALTGFDFEIGASVPALTSLSPWAYGGLYHFQGPTRDSLWGIRGRLEASLSDAASLNLSVQNDRLFDTTVAFGVEVRFHGGALLKRRPWGSLREQVTRKGNRTSLNSRLAAAIRRQSQIVLDQSEETLAVDPTTGQPITFLHVAAGGSSSGAFDDPYGSLTDALSDPRYIAGNVDVIYVRGGIQQTVLHTGDFTLVDGTTLTSSGPAQLLATRTGMQRLPFSGFDDQLTALPIIDGTVTMGNNTGISGFEIRHPNAQSAIVANGVSNIRIEGIVADFSQMAPGFALSNLNGTLTLAGNRLTGDAGVGFNNGFTRNGVLIQNSVLTGSINDNEIANSVNDAISFVDSSFTGPIAGNDLRGSRNGLAFVDSDSSGDTVYSGTMSGNRFAGNKIAGIAFDKATAQSGSLITANSFEQNQSSAIEIDDSDFAADFLANTIVGPFLGDTTAAEASRIFTVSGGVISFSPPSRDDIDSGFLAFNSNVSGDIRDNMISGTGIYGINVELDSSTALTGDITGNSIREAVFAGIFIRGPRTGNGQPVQSNISNNLVDGSFGTAAETDDTFSGINVSVPVNPFSGNLIGNTTNDLSGTGLRLEAASIIGNITDNESRRNGNATINGSTGIKVASTGDFTGDILRNTVTNNGRAITIGDGFDERLRSFTGDIRENIVNNHVFDGIEVFVTDSFTGNVRDNTALNNEKGIFLSVGTTDSNALAGTITGDVTGNTIRNGRGRGILLFADQINSSVTDNVSDANGVLTFFGAVDPLGGIAIGATNFSGNVENNTADGTIGNTVAGIGFDVVNLSGHVRGNTLRNNSGPGLIVDFTGTFTGNIENNTLTGNQSGGISVPSSSGTLMGNVAGNTANANLGGFGIDLDVNVLDGGVTGNTTSDQGNQGGLRISMNDFRNGNVSGNVASGNNLEGLHIAFKSGGDFNGNIEGNTTSGNTGTGLRVSGNGVFNGNVSGNTSDSAGQGRGIDVAFTGNFTGSVLENTTGSNFSDGIRIALSGGTFTGDVRDNIANSNNEGIELDTGVFSGNITGNTATGNQLNGIALRGDTFQNGNISGNTLDGTVTGDGLDAVITTAFNGSIMNNMVSGAGRNGIGVNLSSATFTGNIADNTLNGNTTTDGGAGIEIQFNGAGAFNGNISGNSLTQNRRGLAVFAFTSPSTFVGDISSNDATGHRLIGLSASGPLAFQGNVSSNTGSSTDANAFNGIDLSLDSFNGTLSGNTVIGARFRGIEVDVNGASPSLLSVLNNTLSGTNTANGLSTEFRLRNTGDGALTVGQFNDNSSGNSVSFGFNFNLVNSGNGSFAVNEVMNNTGTVGSDEGVVTLP